MHEYTSMGYVSTGRRRSYQGLWAHNAQLQQRAPCMCAVALSRLPNAITADLFDGEPISPPRTMSVTPICRQQPPPTPEINIHANTRHTWARFYPRDQRLKVSQPRNDLPKHTEGKETSIAAFSKFSTSLCY